ncbi:MAG: hypothetical protein ACMUJM_23455, partial [bacterium]
RPTPHEEAGGPPKFLTLLLLHATLFDPDTPSGISPNRFLCIGFWHVNTIAERIFTPNGAELLRRGTSLLRPTVFPVYASSIPFFRICTPLNSSHRQYGSSIPATLGTGGWLGLTW